MYYNYRMNMYILQHIIQFHCKIQLTDLLVLGVSGGADSLCLLDVMRRLGYPVVAAHFNHQLRLQAEADEQAVKKLAADWQLPFVCGRGDVAEFARLERLSLEEAARKLRFTFLFEQARQAGAAAVAVAHHAGDQVETILMHFLRGSGIAGLRGMQVRTTMSEWDAEIQLIRPLLGVSREEIERYCLERGLQAQQDATNADAAYFRNRLRLELIPELERYNPNFRAGILQMANVLAGEEQLLQECTSEAWQECCQQVNPGVVQINPRVFSTFPRPLQRRLLREGMGRLLPDLRDLDFAAVERGLDYLDERPTRGRVDIIRGVSLAADLDACFLLKPGAVMPPGDFPQVPAGREIEVLLEGEIELENNWRIRLEMVERPTTFAGGAENKLWLDPERWAGKLLIRRWRRDDQFEPMGMDGKRVKVGDWFAKQHLPHRARSGWPVLAAGDDILWVVGKRAAESGKILPETGNGICLSLLRPGRAA